MTKAGLSIAVVDDEMPVRTALRRVLRQADYEVTTFGSGDEFLLSLKTTRPACVILDVHMPDVSGFDVQAKLRAANERIPVIFITASDDSELEATALATGGLRLLRKPFSSDELLEAINSALPGALCDSA